MLKTPGQSGPVATVDATTGYITNIDEIRRTDYPALSDTVYLDHAGTTLYPKSLIEAYSHELTSNLFGNPHSASASSQLSSRRIDDVRLQVLRFFNANPEEFDVCFVANATAAIKLVGEAFRDHTSGFSYGYHIDSHTSLVGVREIAVQGNHCFRDNNEVDTWFSELLASNSDSTSLQLFAYPGQSNMTGSRLSMDWCKEVNSIREQNDRQIYTLVDVAALVSTSPFDLSDISVAPDFLSLSFYKIFGFPDLGALIVKKESGNILRQRKYFAGGTVDMVTTLDNTWHAKKESSFHDFLEDGTLPFHTIIALESAFLTHARLYGTMDVVSKHTTYLATLTRELLNKLRHSNGKPVCKLYGTKGHPDNEESYGPVIAFNFIDHFGNYVSPAEVEKLAIIKGIQFRTGGLCNPGGVAGYLGLTSEEMRQNYAAGYRCGSENDIIHGKPTGTIRISFGAMSSLADVDRFKDFVEEFFVSQETPGMKFDTAKSLGCGSPSAQFVVESLSVFPIKSCGSFKIPQNTPWKIGPRGLAWDREWCLVHEGTNIALSQKRYPRMALIRPSIDLQKRLLRVVYSTNDSEAQELQMSLDDQEQLQSQLVCDGRVSNRFSNVCGENIEVEIYQSRRVADFFTNALGVPCTLARLPQSGALRQAKMRDSGSTTMSHSIALSNESPILLISRSSVNKLNDDIQDHGGNINNRITPGSFRGNIVIAETDSGRSSKSPYIEEDWKKIRINGVELAVLGPCQRCQMVCVDQKSAQRRSEPFSTLAKTRKRNGRVWFGIHLGLNEPKVISSVYIKIGDPVFGSGA